MNELNVEWADDIVGDLVPVCVHRILLAKISSSLSYYLKSICSKIDWARSQYDHISKRNFIFFYGNLCRISIPCSFSDFPSTYFPFYLTVFFY